LSCGRRHFTAQSAYNGAHAFLEMIVPATLQTLILLTLSNVFMTFAWYAHLKDMNNQPWIIAAFASWGIALFEYPIHTQVRPKWTEFLFHKINGITIFRLSIKFRESMDKSNPCCPFFYRVSLLKCEKHCALENLFQLDQPRFL
jgi:hypothetical protein